MELSIPSEESDSILAIPRRHFAEQGSWVATVTGRPIDPTSPHRQDPRRVGLSLATRLDPTFSADRIFFDPDPLFAAMGRSRRGEVYYLEDIVQAAAGLPQFSRAAPSPVRVLIGAARQHGVGLVLVSPVHLERARRPPAQAGGGIARSKPRTLSPRAAILYFRPFSASSRPQVAFESP